MVTHRGFEPRPYQQVLWKSCTKNTLVCLPTGTGKTKIAILLAVERLNDVPGSKVLIVTPTKPLAAQITEEMKECTTIVPAKIMLLTGTIKPTERKKLFEAASVIVATPQTIQKDIENERISLENVSLLVVDECHRSKERFANTIVAKYYHEVSEHERILALTASPGSTKEKVEDVCDNLFIHHVEIRTEEDPDLAEFLQEKKVSQIFVELPKELQTIREKVRQHYNGRLGNLRKFGFTKPINAVNKTDLLLLQKRFQQEIRRGGHTAYAGLSISAELLKLNYALELIETQTPEGALEYFKKLQSEETKAAKNIISNATIQKAVGEIGKVIEKKIRHPKVAKTKELIEESLREKAGHKSIVFANYRATVNALKREVETIPNAKPVILVGQKDGVTQKQQLKTIEEYNAHKYNVLICTSIGEEGLSIGSLDQAIFYDQTASEIRKIQRSGRVARIKAGSVVNLITKGTRDEGLMWTAKRKETKMHNLLHYMQRRLDKK